MDIKWVVDLVKEVALNEGVVEPMSYSGRGMFGDECLAVTGSRRDCQQLIAQVICELNYAEGTGEFADTVTVLLNFETDSMGPSDIVLYWPHLTV